MTKLPFEPAWNNLLVEKIEKETITKHGVHLPDGTTYETFRGTVVAAGPGSLLYDGTMRPCRFKVGDVILYGKHWASPLEFERGGQEYHLIQDTNPYGTLTIKKESK